MSSKLTLPPKTPVLVLGDGAPTPTLARWFDASGCEVTVGTPHEGPALLLRRPARLVTLVEPRHEPLARACHRLRAVDETPLLALSRGSERARLAAFDAGADDVVSPHISEQELLTRAAALLRRAPGTPLCTTTFGPLTLERTRRTARFGGAEVHLTDYEFALLRVLVTHAGQPVRREALLTVARGTLESSFERSIDVHVCRLRRKLGALGPLTLKTVRGVGYVFEGSSAHPGEPREERPQQ